MDIIMKYLSDVSTLNLIEKNCTGCKICTMVCPREVLGIKEKKAYIKDKDLCIECGACEMNCEFDAIKVDSGVGCATAIINSMITGGEPSCDCSEDGKTSGCC